MVTGQKNGLLYRLAVEIFEFIILFVRLSYRLCLNMSLGNIVLRWLSRG